jgi:hypothetical protein
MSKKESLANSMRRRPNLKREVVGNDEAAKKVVDKVADKSPEKPKTASAPRKAASISTPPQPVPLKRLTIDLPASLHKKLKLATIQSGETMRDHVVKLIEKSLK